MIKVRGLRWPDDREPLLALDTSFATDRVYRIVAGEQSFALDDSPVRPPVCKVYDLAGDVDRLPQLDDVVVAEDDAVVVGMAALAYEAWNRRAVLEHLYVAPAYRGRGLGWTLMEHVVQAAHQWRARCVWLETQNVNYGAIQFYRRFGFQWCGLDLSLYDSQGSAAGEMALFFVRALP